MKKLLLLLANGFEMYEASVFIDIFGWNMVDGDKTTRVVICGLTREIASTFGARVIADITVDQIDVDDYDGLAIPGGFEEFKFYEDAYNEKFLNVIREFHAKKKPIAAVCTGGLAIGKSGILQRKRGTTYDKNRSIRFETLRSFGVDVVKEPIVEDSNVITSWDPSTAVEVSFRMLEKLTSPAQADLIKQIMGFDKIHRNENQII